MKRVFDRWIQQPALYGENKLWATDYRTCGHGWPLALFREVGR